MRKPRRAAIVKIVPALTARTQFGQILKRVKQNGERFVVDRRGEPQAVIMSVDEYIRKFAKFPAALKRIHKDAERRGLDRMSLRDINQLIRQVRRARRRAHD